MKAGDVVTAFISGGGGGTGTVTSVSVTTANGVSGAVATATITPAITLTLGAITPSSVAASGTVTGSNLSGTNTGDNATPLFSAISGSVISATTNIVQTSGRTVAGQYSAFYVRSAAADQNTYTANGNALIAAAASAAAAQTDILAILNRVRFADSTGSYWEIEDTNQVVHAGHFGFVDDGAYNEVTGVMTGTDNAAAIQALIDWRIHLKMGTASARKECLIPAGVGRISTPLQLSYADSFKRVALRGAGGGLDPSIGGTILLCDFDNYPGVIMQGGRRQRVEGITLVSAGRAWYLAKNLMSLNHDSYITYSLDDRLIASHFDPAKPNRNPALRYNPHAGIAVDPFLGTAPATAYPALLPPAFIPAAARITYGKPYASSKMVIRDVAIIGFAVGLAVQPCDADANGDFPALEDVLIGQCPVPVSIGNTQCRNLDVNRTDFSFFHTMLTTTMHGRQLGRAEGVWKDCSVSGGINYFDIGAQGSRGSLTFINMYGEAMLRWGQLGPTGATGVAIAFRGGTSGFNHIIGNGNRGVPLYLIGRAGAPGGAGGEAMPFILDGIDVAAFKGLAVVGVTNVDFRNCSFAPDDDTAVTTQWRARALNTTAGGVVLPLLKTSGDAVIRYKAQSETSLGAFLARVARRGNALSSRDYPSSMYSPTLSPSQGDSREEIVNPVRVVTLDKATISAALSARNLTFNAAQALSTALTSGLVPGAVIYDDSNGMAFIIKTRTGSPGAYVITAELQNGYWYNNAGVIQYEVAFGSTGNLYIHGGGTFTPLYPLLADLTVTSSTLANIERGDGYGGFINATGTSAVQAGDVLYSDQFIDAAAYPPGLSASSVGAASITLSGVVSQTIAKRRLPLWVRGS